MTRYFALADGTSGGAAGCGYPPSTGVHDASIPAPTAPNPRAAPYRSRSLRVSGRSHGGCEATPWSKSWSEPIEQFWQTLEAAVDMMAPVVAIPDGRLRRVSSRIIW